MTTTEDLFLLQIKNGDKNAFDKFYQMYWEHLYAFAFKISGGDTQLSEMVVQDIFIYVWENRKDLKINNVKSYLLQATKFQVFKYYKQHNNKYTVYLEDQFDEFITESGSHKEIHAVYELLETAINTLPPKRKEVILLNKLKGKSISEISLLLNIAPQTVKNQLNLGMKELKMKLKNNEDLLNCFMIFYITIR